MDTQDSPTDSSQPGFFDLSDGSEGDRPTGPAGPTPATPAARPRLRSIVRNQIEMRTESLDQRLPAVHQARDVWAYVEQLDLSAVYGEIQAVEGRPGRDTTDPRVLVALWLYATIDGIGSARKLDELCRNDRPYEWLAGGASLNYHTLSHFRVSHGDVLDELFTHSVATLLHEDLIDLKRVAQDGMRVRASAGASSFRREPTLRRCLEEAEAQVQALKLQVGEEATAVSQRQEAARQRAARERQERLQRALQERQQLAELRERQKREKGVKYDPQELRISTTDPQARKMKMPDGGVRPAYNVQFATTTQTQVIVGVDVTNSGSDSGQMQPMVEQIEARYGRAPQEYLADGGFATMADIEQVSTGRDTKVYTPVKDEGKKRAAGVDPFSPRPKDSPAVAEWRRRMGTPEAQTIYVERAATAECANAQARNRNLYQFRVRGLKKVRVVAVWIALAHNVVRMLALRAAAGLTRG
jgi:transposase